MKCRDCMHKLFNAVGEDVGNDKEDITQKLETVYRALPDAVVNLGNGGFCLKHYVEKQLRFW